MVEKWVQRTAAECAQSWNNLLPTGPAWPRQSGTALQEVITGLSGIWGIQVEALAALLLKIESDPRSTNILLPEWERAFGLPDICIPIPPSDVASRDINLVAKMTFLGAQSRAFFIAQAAAIGQTVNIREYAPYMTGVSRCGDTTHDDDDGTGIHFRWQLGAPEQRFVWTVAVTALLSNWKGADLGCLLNRWKPAHTAVIFNFASLQDLDESLFWDSGYIALL